MAARPTDQGRPLASFIPAEFTGWTIEEDQVFDAETIFKYVDGAGEVYRSYNMKSLFARRFAAKGKPALVVDLFDMGTSEDAFGLFTHDLDGEDAATGQGSTYKGGLLSFWKGRYFASVYAEDETPETKQAVSGSPGRSMRPSGRQGRSRRSSPCFRPRGSRQRTSASSTTIRS